MGCERDFNFRGDESGLSFSADTLSFDTVFTAMGSATLHLKIYNPTSQDMTIDAIELAGGVTSNYRLNINGEPTVLKTDIRLRGRDSLFVFVDVTINPSGENVPFVVTDSVMVYTRERLQTVQLLAFGQDVVRLNKAWLKTQSLTKDKPYLIQDFLVVDSAETVTIEAGARLHFAKDASLLVLGTLLVEGTLEEPVRFSGDRLESWYKDKPGQWGYIHLLPGSGTSSFQYAHIKNARTGVVVDSVGLGTQHPVKISNCRIEHVSGYGLLAQSAGLEVNNTLISDCGKSLVALTVGGNYSFLHCTLANYYAWSFRTDPALLLRNYYTNESGQQVVKDFLRVLFRNCIVYGRNENEITIDLKKNQKGKSELPDQNILLSHCLVKVPKNLDTSGSMYQNLVRDKDPLFVNTQEYNFQLDTLSGAQNTGNLIFALELPFDILGKSRFEDRSPDLGAFERIEKK